MVTRCVYGMLLEIEDDGKLYGWICEAIEGEWMSTLVVVIKERSQSKNHNIER